MEISRRMISPSNSYDPAARHFDRIAASAATPRPPTNYRPALDHQGLEAKMLQILPEHRHPCAGPCSICWHTANVTKPKLFRTWFCPSQRKRRCSMPLLEPWTCAVIGGRRAQPAFGRGAGLRGRRHRRSRAGRLDAPADEAPAVTLDQSLLLAILRRGFAARARKRHRRGGARHRGQPVATARNHLGSTGSDMQERKRLTQLLENLRNTAW